MNLGAQQSMDVQIPVSSLKQGREYFVNFDVYTAKATTLVPNNFNIAHGQFKLPSEIVKESYRPATASQNIKTTKRKYNDYNRRESCVDF